MPLSSLSQPPTFEHSPATADILELPAAAVAHEPYLACRVVALPVARVSKNEESECLNGNTPAARPLVDHWGVRGGGCGADTWRNFGVSGVRARNPWRIPSHKINTKTHSQEVRKMLPQIVHPE